MYFKNTLTFILATFLLASCNSNQVKPDTEANNKENTVSPENGLLISSVTRGMRKGNFFTKKQISAFFYILKASEIEKYEKDKTKFISSDNRIRLSSHDYKLLGQSNELQEYGADGKLNVTQLTPGEYAIIGWELYVPSGYTEKEITPKEFKHQYFNIKSNEVTYIGNLHLETLYGRNLLGIAIEGGAASECTDMSTRDLSIFKEKYNTYNSWPISTELVEC